MALNESADIQRRIQAFFDDLAGRWDSIVNQQHAPKLCAIVERLGIPKVARILDVGTGTGVLLPFLAPQAISGRRVTAVDLSFEMLRRAAQHPDINRRAVSLAQADATGLPFAPDVFDWVLCNSVFPHFSDQPACVRELARVLRPGGRLMICHSQSRKAINELHHSHGGIIGGHELPAKPVMIRMMTAAGLEVNTFESTETHYLLVAEKRG